jgi:K+-transporting ATPase ATPase C chain
MKNLLISLKILLFFTILTGGVYPLVVTGIVQVAFHAKANGSMITREGRPAGSALIGQSFDSAIYFSSRPTAVGYNPLPSGGSNLGLTSIRLKELVSQRRQLFMEKNNLDSRAAVPSEMLFASASGLDPHTSVQAAVIQVDRVARSRHFDQARKEKLLKIIADMTEPPQYLFLGEKRINILLLNLEVDKIK